MPHGSGPALAVSLVESGVKKKPAESEQPPEAEVASIYGFLLNVPLEHSPLGGCGQSRDDYRKKPQEERQEPEGTPHLTNRLYFALR